MLHEIQFFNLLNRITETFVFPFVAGNRLKPLAYRPAAIQVA
jgi:hypothetical protein